MKYTVVTTFNAQGYEKYGQKMIQTFLKNWPVDINLVVYAERCQVLEQAPNLTVLDLEQASNAMVQFKQKWQNVPKANGDVSSDPIRSQRKDAGKGFKWDAVRFCHKVYAIFHAAQHCSSNWLLWMDADIVCHSAISLKDLDRLCPKDKDLCYLGRERKFSECGLYAMNLQKPVVSVFLQKFQHMYDHAEDGIFMLDEWHDSFVFDVVRKSVEINELNWSKNLIVGEGHPLINCEWGRYLDHLKGERKKLGHSKAKDLQVPRKEDYWRSVLV